MIRPSNQLKERRSISILCGRALLSTAFVPCHMKMAAAVESTGRKAHATRSKDAGWQAFFKRPYYGLHQLQVLQGFRFEMPIFYKDFELIYIFGWLHFI